MATPYGHLFVVRGNLLRFGCDALVIPTDVNGKVEDPWRKYLRGRDLLANDATHLADRPARRGHAPAGTPGDGTPAVWTVPTGVAPPNSQVDVAFDQQRLEAVLQGFARAFVAEQRGREPLGGRSCPLIAVPFLGSGAGGFVRRLRSHSAALLPLLAAAAQTAKADIAIVLHGTHERAWEALLRQERRKLKVIPTLEGLAARWEVGPTIDRSRSSAEAAVRSPDTIEVLRRLQQHAGHGTLVPFFGAGVSMAGGGGNWEQLLGGIGEDATATLPEALKDQLTAALASQKVDEDLYGRAQIYEHLLGSAAFAASLRDKLPRRHPSLQHHLLAALESRDAITTNYDTAYEDVGDTVGTPVSVIPSTADAPLRLLKLHGTLPRTDDEDTDLAAERAAMATAMPPVLTREQLLEHQRHSGSLRGALEMMLLTGHVAFVGYSLRDSHLHAAIHQVQRIRERVATDTPVLATAIQVEPTPSLSLEWGGTIDAIWPRSVGSTAEGEDSTATVPAGRELEILLDVLADATKLADVPVLAFHDKDLQPDEEALKQALEPLEAAFSDPAQRPPRIAALLEAYGGSHAAPGDTP